MSTTTARQGKPRRAKLSVADLEKAMGRKADHISDYSFDPETMSWGRTITFDLKPKRKSKRARAAKATGGAA